MKPLSKWQDLLVIYLSGHFYDPDYSYKSQSLNEKISSLLGLQKETSKCALEGFQWTEVLRIWNNQLVTPNPHQDVNKCHRIIIDNIDIVLELHKQSIGSVATPKCCSKDLIESIKWNVLSKDIFYDYLIGKC